MNQKINQDLRPNIPQRKRTLILVDLIVKHVESWQLIKGCIPAEIINAIKHHLKGCLKDSFPDIIILHHETNNPKNDNNLEIIARDIVNLGLSWYIFQV